MSLWQGGRELKTLVSSRIKHGISCISLTELVTKVKPNINSVEVHPQWSNNGCTVMVH
jgi:hypothetical protein